MKLVIVIRRSRLSIHRYVMGCRGLVLTGTDAIAMPRQIVVSSPGKVLLAGGYLVLEPSYAGIVIGTASRFYTGVTQGSSTANAKPVIVVRSPQFVDAVWTYTAQYHNDTLTLRQHENGAPRNGFVEKAIEAALKVSFASTRRPLSTDLDVAIVGDNDFYSQKRSNAEQAEPAPFQHLGCKISEVHKTGLGSSAAMVTSLIGALLLYLDPASPSSNGHAEPLMQPHERQLQLIHNTSQYAHSSAQGKIGSGFDVSAAVWGSHLYNRFDPLCLQALLDNYEVLPNDLLSGLHHSNELWLPGSRTAPRVRSIALPHCTALLLADVDAGSNTPSMVSKVLKWQNANPKKAKELWEEIDAANSLLIEIINALNQSARDDAKAYEQTIQDLSIRPASDWSENASQTEANMCGVRDLIAKIRRGMKTVGEHAQVQIEPDEQTRLLDETNKRCTGVIGGGVPGAGGYDAIWTLVWKTWAEMSVSSLSKKARVIGSINQQRSNSSGLVLHSPNSIDGLADAIS